MQLAPLFPLLHPLLSPLFSECLWEGCSTSKTIALTFDDGPHPRFTPQLLEVLQQYGVPASFFWLGNCVNRSPAIAQEIYNRGYWVGLHGYDHRSFPLLNPEALKGQLEQTQREIAQACQLDILDVQQRMRDVRPPNGLFTPQTLDCLKQWQYRAVMWSVVPEDWVRPGRDCVVQRVLSQTRNGSLIVLHDGYCGGEDVAAIAADLIPHLLNQGYEFVTIDALWRQRQRAALTRPPGFAP